MMQDLMPESRLVARSMSVRRMAAKYMLTSWTPRRLEWAPPPNAGLGITTAASRERVRTVGARAEEGARPAMEKQH
jgi:hypothetical protein